MTHRLYADKQPGVVTVCNSARKSPDHNLCLIGKYLILEMKYRIDQAGRCRFFDKISFSQRCRVHSAYILLHNYLAHRLFQSLRVFLCSLFIEIDLVRCGSCQRLLALTRSCVNCNSRKHRLFSLVRRLHFDTYFSVQLTDTSFSVTRRLA